ncbi:hypothetical protein ACFX1Z_002016 [Malus domestica]
MLNGTRKAFRKIFELFLYTHHLYIVFLVFFVFHVGFSYACIMLPSFYLFLIDRFLRFLQCQRRIRVVSARVLPCEAVELNFSKSPELNYSPTSMVFVIVSGIVILCARHPPRGLSRRTVGTRLKQHAKARHDSDGERRKRHYSINLRHPRAPLRSQ